MTRRAALFLCATAAFAQRRQRTTPGSAPTPTWKDLPLAEFHGVLRSLTKKEVELQTDSEETMVFRRMKKTRFVKEGKDYTPDKFKAGDVVTVEGRKEFNGDLTAYTVTLELVP